MIRSFFNAAFISLATVLFLSLGSCNPGNKLQEQEDADILGYLNNNSNLNFVQKTSGLYYLEVLAGTGELPAKSDTAYIMYTGKLIDGTVFDTNVGTTDTLVRPVSEGWLIAGVDEGISYLKVGGKALLLIPSKLGYGPSGYYYIPGYCPLLFDIELVRLVPGPGK